MKVLLGVGVLTVLSSSAVWSVPSAAAQSVSVPIAFHRQEHSLSCELAALKMALGSHGITVAEGTLIADLPFDTTRKTAGMWGNPNKGFVGSINGRMMVTGYGVHWDPIAALGSRYARTRVLHDSSPVELARAVATGNPVIIWGYYGPGIVHSWQTPDGVPVRAVNSEHARVVYGFDGPPSAPTHFYVMDPLVGQLTWSTAELLTNWQSFNYAGVVVAPRWVRAAGDTKVWEISADGLKRHWVTNWATFATRGGSADRVRSIAPSALARYTIGSPLP